MPRIDAAREALAEGGVAELVRRTRLWSAGKIYPGVMPRPRPKRPRVRPAPTPSARDVGHAAALAWFDERRSTYERLATAVAPYVDPEGVFFDVGANIGYFTRTLAEQTGFRGTAHLFEPVPHLVGLCAQTLAGAPYESVVHAFGLSDTDATLDLYLSADGNLGWNTMVAAKATPGMVRTEIEVRSWASSGVTDVPTFIKIDVEGAEHRVLTGLLPALRTWTRRPAILCEIGWGTTHPDWTDELAAFAAMTAIGYRIVDLDGRPIDVATLTRTTDVLFLPS
ncbi:FkbM family methyltransferase [Marmoricola sp. OAE513]|uniref:FkbM family methyltransferase n=1 Tax=Marmoricola sp. OAE513 TaxID=2817894 RepID=UPI001AEB8ABC